MPAPIQIEEADWGRVQHVLQTHVSDMDLALISKAPLSLQRLADITSAFEESDLTIRVDVVVWVAGSQAFRDVIAKDKVVVQQIAR